MHVRVLERIHINTSHKRLLLEVQPAPRNIFTTASCLHDDISQVQDVRLFEGPKGLDRGNACQEVPIWNE